MLGLYLIHLGGSYELLEHELRSRYGRLREMPSA